MAKFWRRFNPDLKAYFSHFRRGIFVFIGLALIAVLIVASFIYGNNQREQEATQNGAGVSEQEQAAESQGQASEDVDRPGEEPGSGTRRPTARRPSGGLSTTGPSEVAVTGPQEIANTGPEDWAPWMAAALGILAYSYRRTKRSLSSVLER